MHKFDKLRNSIIFILFRVVWRTTHHKTEGQNSHVGHGYSCFQAIASDTSRAQPNRFLASPLFLSMPMEIILCRLQLTSWFLTLSACHLCGFSFYTPELLWCCCRIPHQQKAIPCIDVQPAEHGSPWWALPQAILAQIIHQGIPNASHKIFVWSSYSCP